MGHTSSLEDGTASCAVTEAGSVGTGDVGLRGAVFLCESSGKPEEEMHTSENQSGWASCDSTAVVEETA